MVSIIVPTYNYGRFISDCLQSLLNQSMPNWECLVIDNASTDDTEKVCTKFIEDTRIKYIKLDNNYGPGHARNVGLKRANGDFILFLDSDDLIESEKLRKSIDYLMTHPEIDLVYGDMRYFKDNKLNKLYFDYQCSDSNDQAWMKYCDGSGENLVNEILSGNIMVISSPIFRTDILKLIGYFDERIAYNEDWDLWLRMALHNKTFKYLNSESTKALIRSHSTSTSRDVFKMQMCGLYVLIKNAESIKSYQLHKQLKERILDHVKAISATLIKADKTELKLKLDLLQQLNLSGNIFKIKTNNYYLIRMQLRLNLLF